MVRDKNREIVFGAIRCREHEAAQRVVEGHRKNEEQEATIAQLKQDFQSRGAQ